MDPCDRHLGLRWQLVDEFEVCVVGENPTGLGLQEQLGHAARREPLVVGRHDGDYVGGLALDRDLPGPGQRRPSSLAGLGERPPVLRHLLGGEGAQDGLRQNLLDEKVVSPAAERSPCRAVRMLNLSQWSQRCGTTIASIYAIPFTALRWRLAQSKPRAEPQSWITKVTRSCTFRASSRASR